RRSSLHTNPETSRSTPSPASWLTWKTALLTNPETSRITGALQQPVQFPRHRSACTIEWSSRPFRLSRPPKVRPQAPGAGGPKPRARAPVPDGASARSGLPRRRPR
ncbi:hypothetical protein ANANG_G00089830, partial [Anguilla anguilla]